MQSELVLSRGHHFVQHHLERHRVAASVAANKKFAIAMPTAVFELDLVRAVLAVKAHGERFDLHAAGLRGVRAGFFHFAYQSSIHMAVSCLVETKTHAASVRLVAQAICFESQFSQAASCEKYSQTKTSRQLRLLYDWQIFQLIIG